MPAYMTIRACTGDRGEAHVAENIKEIICRMYSGNIKYQCPVTAVLSAHKL